MKKFKKLMKKFIFACTLVRSSSRIVIRSIWWSTILCNHSYVVLILLLSVKGCHRANNTRLAVDWELVIVNANFFYAIIDLSKQIRNRSFIKISQFNTLGFVHGSLIVSVLDYQFSSWGFKSPAGQKHFKISVHLHFWTWQQNEYRLYTVQWSGGQETDWSPALQKPSKWCSQHKIPLTASTG